MKIKGYVMELLIWEDELLGNTYGYLRLLGCCKRKNRVMYYVLCQNCGTYKLIRKDSLYRRKYKTCGCRPYILKKGDTLNINGTDILVTSNIHKGYIGIYVPETGYTDRINESNLRVLHSFKDPLKPSVKGVGYIGIGCHSARDKKKYQVWYDMLERCYGESVINKRLYNGVTVCKQWHNFQNFGDWFEDNYISGWSLDKDLKIIDNKEYHPDKCLFVPLRINSFLTCNIDNGITYVEENNKPYKAQCIFHEQGKRVNHYLGCYYTKMEAVNAYIDFKIGLVRQLKQMYPNVITPDIENNMMIKIERLREV